MPSSVERQKKAAETDYQDLKKIFREKGAIIGDGRTTRSFIDDYNESGLMFLDHFFMNAWGNENQESEYLAEGLQSGELKKVLYPDLFSAKMRNGMFP